MRRLAVFLLVAGALGACGQNEAGKKAIAEQCIENGDTVEVCECLGEQSAEKLDAELFAIVVLGAQGEDLEAARRMDELSPDLQARFAAAIPDILKGCGAEGYVAGS